MSHTASSTAVSVAGTAVPKILVVGGGYAGFYTAWKLEKHLRKGEADVTIVDPLPYMTYQPFLPEVAAGSIQSRHVVAPHRRNLDGVTIITGAVTAIDHAGRTVTVRPPTPQSTHERVEPYTLTYDHLVIATGAAPVLPDTLRPLADGGAHVVAVELLDHGCADHAGQ